MPGTRKIRISLLLSVAAAGLPAGSALSARAALPRGWAVSQQMGQARSQNDPYGAWLNNLTCGELARFSRRYAGARTTIIPTYTVSYGQSPLQSIDIYTPTRNGEGKLDPVIVMVHGGAWCVGDKDLSAVVTKKVKRWVSKGFVFASVDYRMLPTGADVMTQAGDVASAIAYVENHAHQWGGNASELIVMGHSAGGHLVSLLSAEPRLAARFGARPWLGTISLDSAALNIPELMLAPHPTLYDDAFGKDPAFWVSVSPAQHLSLSSLRWCGVCSTQRKDSCAQAQAYARRAKEYGVRAEVLEEDMSHKQINAELGEPGAYTEAVESFMASLSPNVQAHLRMKDLARHGN